MITHPGETGIDPAPMRKPGPSPHLSSRQGTALIYEAWSVRNLLRDAVGAIRDLRDVALHGDSVFTVGSIGVEKAMKIMLGCKEVEALGSWPTQKTLRGWGHDIPTLNDYLESAIEVGLTNCMDVPYSKRLASQIRQSTVLPMIFTALGRYGKSGRFHHLDILATDELGSDDSPLEYWEKIEDHIRTIASEFQDVPYGHNRALDEYDSRVRGRIAEELDTWWFCLHRLGVQGCFGELGKRIGWEIWEHNRPQPAAVQT